MRTNIAIFVSAGFAVATILISSCATTSLSPAESDTEISTNPLQSFPQADDLEPMAPSPAIKYGRSCNECDTNIKYGLKCTIVAKKACGKGDHTVGAGFCVALPTDTKGYCSGRCKTKADCKSGYSCTDLGTGAGGMCVR